MCHNSCKRQDHTVRLRYSGILEALGVLGVSEASPYSSFSQGLLWMMRNLLWCTAGHSRRQAGLTIPHREVAALQLVHPRQGSKMQPRGSQCLGEHPKLLPVACWQLSVRLSGTLPCATRGLCCWAALAAWAEKAPTPAEVAGIWASPPRCQRPEAGENKRAARDTVNYQAYIKRLLTVCPWTSVCCAIAIYRHVLSGTLLKCVCGFDFVDYFSSCLRFAQWALPIQLRWLESPETSVSVLMDGLSLTFC